MHALFSRFLKRLRPADDTPLEIQRAKRLISAIDAGGIPLDPAIIVRIAEDLGLEVSRKALADDTIERIRMAIARY